ncbi:MAG: hypothetical protein KatS3mg082_1555 [Nitrospiraceae bacterium]|nr:MAG: hypothetical protein KatS3mg082_1555 [Nitrospiraceae bacterium]
MVRERRPSDRQSSPTREAISFHDRSLGGLDPKDVSPEVLDRLIGLCDPPRHAAVLLHAPPEYRLACLLRVADAMLARERAVLVVTGEVLRAGQVAHQAKSRWGDRVVLVHSGLPAAVRAEGWRRIRAGTASVVIGTRSAVFAPVSSPGLVWIDGRRRRLAQGGAGAPLPCTGRSLGSAPAGVGRCSYSARPIRRWRPCRRLSATEARSTLRSQLRVSRGWNWSISGRIRPARSCRRRWSEGIDRALAQRNRVALFLNRKGYARALTCRDCGSVPRCEHCSVSLAYYRRIRPLDLPVLRGVRGASRYLHLLPGGEARAGRVRHRTPGGRRQTLLPEGQDRTPRPGRDPAYLAGGSGPAHARGRRAGLDHRDAVAVSARASPPVRIRRCTVCGRRIAPAGLSRPLNGPITPCWTRCGWRVRTKPVVESSCRRICRPTMAVAAVVDRDFQMFVKTELAVRRDPRLSAL